MRIANRIYSLLFSCMALPGFCAQTIKNVSVSQEHAYTDHIGMEVDATDKDIMVKFVFDEAANQLTVNLISHRMIFVFRDDARYKPLIKGKKLRPEMLPYVVACEPTDRYTLSKAFRRSLPRPRKKHIFHRWIEYEGLQPAPQEYAMVNDYISQTFDIQKKRNSVVVRLRDILLMNDISKHPDKRRYEINFGRDLDTEYRIEIQRNPCFGMEEEVASARTVLDGISKSYGQLHKKYGNGLVANQELLSVFTDLKETLVKQYPRKDIQSPCPDLQEAWDAYNAYTDSIAAMTCKVAPANTGAYGGGGGGEGVSTKTLLAKARQIDAAVSRWLLSSDPVERRDIISQTEEIIESINTAVKTQGVRSQEQQQALSVFREAERYFRNNCQKR